MIDIAERKRKIFLINRKFKKPARKQVIHQEIQSLRKKYFTRIFWVHKIVIKGIFQKFLESHSENSSENKKNKILQGNLLKGVNLTVNQSKIESNNLKLTKLDFSNLPNQGIFN